MPRSVQRSFELGQCTVPLFVLAFAALLPQSTGAGARGMLPEASPGSRRLALAGPDVLEPPLPPLNLPLGRGWDWSRAGYQDGKLPVPSPPVTWNVRSFGAKGNGRHNDTAALLAAIEAANNSPTGGVVYLPPGTYHLDRPLAITHSNVVIRGAGVGETTLYIPVPLAEAVGERWVTSPDYPSIRKSAWSFVGGFITFKGREQRRGSPITFLSKINGSVWQGGYKIPVASTGRFQRGRWIRIFVNDNSTGTTCDHLGFCRRRRRLALLNDNGATSPGVADDLQSFWLSSRHELFDGNDAPQAGGEATPQQRSSGTVAPAAALGTVASWLYGEGLVDSGSDTGAVDQDTISITARVLLIGPDYIVIDRPMPFPVQPWWDGSIHLLDAPLQHSGVEHLRVKFRHRRAATHLKEPGYNAFHFGGVRNCWIRNVTILNADNGILFFGVDHSNIEDVTINCTSIRARAPNLWYNNGHHAISIIHGHYNLITRFNVALVYNHDITVGRAAMLNVFRRGRGLNLNLDHHKGAPIGNLFVDLDMGCGTRPFASSGAPGNGAQSGRGSTFVNLQATRRCPPHPSPGKLIPLPDIGSIILPGCRWGPLLNFLGNFTQEQVGRCNETGWLVLPQEPLWRRKRTP